MGRLMHHCLLFLSIAFGMGSSALWLWAQFSAPADFDWSLHAGQMPNYKLVIEPHEVFLVRNSTIYGTHAEKCDFLTQLCKRPRFSKFGVHFLGIADHLVYGPAYDGGYSVQAEVHVRFGVFFSIFATLAGLAAVRPIRRVIRSALNSGRCSCCGYDVRGSFERCPECGAVQKKCQQKSLDCDKAH